MTIETLSKSASTENRLAAPQWVDALNARDDEGEADARTVDYIRARSRQHALPALGSDAWVVFWAPFSRDSPTYASTCRTPWPMRR